MLFKKRSAKLKMVENIAPKPAANREYVYLLVKDDNTYGVDFPLLFTRVQIEVAANRARKNPEDLPRVRRGLLRRIFR